MDSSVDPAPPRFGRRRAEAVERPGDARHALRAHREVVGGPEQVRQDPGRRCAQRAVGRRVGREVRGHQERRPGRVGLGAGVAVGVGGPDSSDRPPEVVGVLGVPAGDLGVGLGDVEQGEQAGVLDQAEPPVRGHLLGDPVPVPHGERRAESVIPELGDLRLLVRPGRAAHAAQILDLVEGGRVLGAVQSGRRRGAELRTGGQGEWRHVRPLRGQRGQVGGRGRLPVPWVGPRRVRHHCGRAVGAPPIEDLLGGVAPHHDALTGQAGGDAHQVGGEGRVEGARLAGEQGRQRVVGRLRRRRLGRGPARGLDVGVVGLE